MRELRLRQLVPAKQIIVSLDSWEYGKSYPRVVLPPDLEPATCNFDFLAALDVVLVLDPTLTSLARRDAVLRELLACDPASLRCFEMTDPVRVTWVKSRARGIELSEYA